MVNIDGICTGGYLGSIIACGSMSYLGEIDFTYQLLTGSVIDNELSVFKDLRGYIRVFSRSFNRRKRWPERTIALTMWV
jgi:predicted aconitase with swiveling domain